MNSNIILEVDTTGLIDALRVGNQVKREIIGDSRLLNGTTIYPEND